MGNQQLITGEESEPINLLILEKARQKLFGITKSQFAGHTELSWHIQTFKKQK